MKRLFLFFLTSFTASLFAQHNQIISPQPSSQIVDEIKGLNSFVKVLYVAAHPDDENTRLITYFARYKHFETGYLSMTRGDGGQNLIGPEIRDGLGLIRTQELIAARKTDGGRQFFSSANDFGYSKNPTETFSKWDKDKVLSDAIYVIRKFQPDIIITRFPETPGITHGHHTGSAIIAREAFDLASDPNTYPEQLKFVDTWQPKKIYWNTSPWFYRGRNEEFDTTNLVKVDVGHYLPSMGESIEEIAGRSRSMHKSQGFGSSGARGESFEWLVPVETKKGTTNGDLYSGIKTSWKDFGAPQIENEIEQIIKDFDALNPGNSVEELISLKDNIKKLNSSNQKVKDKLSQIDNIIIECLGLYVGVHTDKAYFSPGDTVNIDFEAVNRSEKEIKIVNIDLPGSSNERTGLLSPNKPFTFKSSFVISENEAYTDPYWLNGNQTDANFDVESYNLIGKPENEPRYNASLTLSINKEQINLMVPITYHTTDRVKGKVIQPLHIIPEINIEPDQKVMVLPVNKSRTVTVTLSSESPIPSGTVKINLPDGITANQKEINYNTNGVERIKSFDFTISAKKPTDFMQDNVSFEFITGTRSFKDYTLFVEYDHIPNQIDVKASKMTISAVDITVPDVKVGYIMGAGDEIPELLSEVGMDVKLIGVEDLNGGKNIPYDVIILGVRALNTLPELSRSMDKIYTFVENGGTAIVQYNTSYGLSVPSPGPYPISISRDRVTNEDSPVTILHKDHPALNKPNKITNEDFNNWVQERGLYFPSSWDNNYTPMLSMNDQDEGPLEGSLLIANYGKGHYIYTGLSFFRELPAGVPGAYRLFINLIGFDTAADKP
ncbi:PIG-L family deacetylase [Marinigracilibium pacificum]|uniref:PIG-L family deacetylase n=1 Tax=Marinigracilibium pacificum TaxID=2729599 RepID=A0A848IYN8_9BACT|nr:PIG-L family deacetylase [Marinigracilibium pacificum]NMM48395.1 PIG-L family deacetylase [Marinigracilibium pacificum]